MEDIAVNDKWEKITNLILKNMESCDLLFSFFNSALNSSRSGSRLRPFPPAYLRNGEKDFEGLRNMCTRMPTFPYISREPLQFQDERCIEFLDWLFTQYDPRNLKPINYCNIPVPKLLRNVNYKRPTYVFAVKYQNDDAWLRKRGSYNTFFAFHGSKLENFYSIYRVGLQQIFSTDTNPMFGEGIYFSMDLQVSISFAPYGLGWQNSMLGNRMSVVTLCEIIDKPSKVDRQNLTSGYYNSNQTCQATSNYIIVKDSDLVRIKYFLVYARKIKNQSFRSLLNPNFILYFILLLVGFYFFKIVSNLI